MELKKIEKILQKEPEQAAEELLKEVEKAYGEVPYILNEEIAGAFGHQDPL
jgi:hypothetical protein